MMGRAGLPRSRLPGLVAGAVVPLAALLVIVACLKTATAQLGNQPAAANLARCFGADIDFRIMGCTALLDSGEGTAMDRAEVLINRGSAFLSKGQDNRAVQDFDAATLLDPSAANAFLHQDDPTLRRGQLGQAVEDFEKACRSRPELQLCQKRAGPARADTNSAEKDFAVALASAPLLVRDLQCRDIVSPYGTALADPDFRKWFDGFMAPVADTGISMDQMYNQLLADCAQDQNWSAVGATLQFRQLMHGMTPQYAGGR